MLSWFPTFKFFNFKKVFLCTNFNKNQQLRLKYQKGIIADLFPPARDYNPMWNAFGSDN